LNSSGENPRWAHRPPACVPPALNCPPIVQPMVWFAA